MTQANTIDRRKLLGTLGLAGREKSKQLGLTVTEERRTPQSLSIRLAPFWGKPGASLRA
jgi:hypothetical protein